MEGRIASSSRHRPAGLAPTPSPQTPPARLYPILRTTNVTTTSTPRLIPRLPTPVLYPEKQTLNASSKGTACRLVPVYIRRRQGQHHSSIDDLERLRILIFGARLATSHGSSGFGVGDTISPKLYSGIRKTSARHATALGERERFHQKKQPASRGETPAALVIDETRRRSLLT